MAEGYVLWFRSERGRGGIRMDGGGPDLAVHAADIQMLGYRELVEGETVSFEVVRGPRGLVAKHVVPLGGRRRAPSADRRQVSPEQARRHKEELRRAVRRHLAAQREHDAERRRNRRRRALALLTAAVPAVGAGWAALSAANGTPALWYPAGGGVLVAVLVGHLALRRRG